MNRQYVFCICCTIRRGVRTFELPEVDAVCDRVLIIDRGRIVAEGTPEELRSKLAGTPTIRVAFRGDVPAEPALATLPGEYMTFGVGLVVDAASAQAVRGTLAMMEELFEPVDTGRRYLNFVEEPTDPARFFDADAYARLRHVKAVFDPYRVIRANHPIRPAVGAMC